VREFAIPSDGIKPFDWKAAFERRPFALVFTEVNGVHRRAHDPQPSCAARWKYGITFDTQSRARRPAFCELLSVSHPMSTLMSVCRRAPAAVRLRNFGQAENALAPGAGVTAGNAGP
jgi:hypothetical protein